MKTEKIEKIKDEKKDNILIVEIEVERKSEAYEIVAELGFFNKVLRAKYKGFDEKFDDHNKPANFTKIKNKKVRDVREEIKKENKKLKESIWD